MENSTELIILSIISFSVLLIWIYGKKEPEKDNRTFQGLDTEEYIKNTVGENYYNKHYKK